MNYPMWEVPGIGTPWVIGLIAIFHVMISHFAVGGGLYLAFAIHKARKENRREWLPIIKKHARFFLVLTGVFGTASGVGIWFAIGLVNPTATSALIHNFVFGWAIEWLFFAVELTSAIVFYYSWDRISDKLHQQVANVYAISSLGTLVIINGILTFMLTPGHVWLHGAGTGNEPYLFWNGFFNPTYWPSFFMRLFACISLAGIWGLISFSRLEPSRQRDQMIKWSATWLIPSFLCMPLAFLWYRAMIPVANRHLTELGIATIGSGADTVVTRIALVCLMSSATIAAIAYFFAYKSSNDFTPGHAVSLLVIALMATASAEYAREAIRKPYVIGSYMYSNGVKVADVAAYRKDGYIAHSVWAPQGKECTFYAEGKFMFRGACMSCHTVHGYRSIHNLIGDRDDRAVTNILVMLRDNKPDSPYHNFMPPLAASDQEIQALKFYLLTLNGKADKNHPPTQEQVASAIVAMNSPGGVAPAPAAGHAPAKGVPAPAKTASVPAAATARTASPAPRITAAPATAHS